MTKEQEPNSPEDMKKAIESAKKQALDFIQKKIQADSQNDPSQPKNFQRVDEIETQRKREEIRTLTAENDSKEADNSLKKQYGVWLIIILAIQLAVMNIIFVLVGLGCLQFEESVLQLFIAGTLTEVFGLVAVVTHYLFKKK